MKMQVSSSHPFSFYIKRFLAIRQSYKLDKSVIWRVRLDIGQKWRIPGGGGGLRVIMLPPNFQREKKYEIIFDQ